MSWWTRLRTIVGKRMALIGNKFIPARGKRTNLPRMHIESSENVSRCVWHCYVGVTPFASWFFRLLVFSQQSMQPISSDAVSFSRTDTMEVRWWRPCCAILQIRLFNVWQRCGKIAKPIQPVGFFAHLTIVPSAVSRFSKMNIALTMV